MKLDLPTELEQLVQRKVQSGRYGSPSDVVREALQLLEQRDELFSTPTAEMRRKIHEGWESAQSGALQDGDQVFDQIEAELDALERASSKK